MASDWWSEAEEESRGGRVNAEWKMTPIPLLAMPMPMSHRHILHTVAEAITTFSLSSHYIVVLNSPYGCISALQHGRDRSDRVLDSKWAHLPILTPLSYLGWYFSNFPILEQLKWFMIYLSRLSQHQSTDLGHEMFVSPGGRTAGPLQRMSCRQPPRAGPSVAGSCARCATLTTREARACTVRSQGPELGSGGRV